jgi:hypothetical protein
LKILHLGFFIKITTKHATHTVKVSWVVLEKHFILLDFLSKGMAFLELIIDLMEKLDVFRHYLSIFLFMDLLIFLEHSSEIVDILLQEFTFLRELLVQVSFTTFPLHLFFDIFLMKSDYTSLQLLEISDVMEALENIIFESLFLGFL